MAADRERHRDPWRPVADRDGRRGAVADQRGDAEDQEREPARHGQHDEHLGAHEELDHQERPERDPDPDGTVAPPPEQLVEAGEDERRHDEGRDHEVRASALEQHDGAEGVERTRHEGGERRADPALGDPHGRDPRARRCDDEGHVERRDGSEDRGDGEQHEAPRGDRRVGEQVDALGMEHRRGVEGVVAVRQRHERPLEEPGEQ